MLPSCIEKPDELSPSFKLRSGRLAWSTRSNGVIDPRLDDVLVSVFDTAVLCNNFFVDVAADFPPNAK